jgi:hypothetical protein
MSTPIKVVNKYFGFIAEREAAAAEEVLSRATT